LIRGEVYDVRLDPLEGSEQGGTRPAVIISRDQLNAVLSTVVIVPCTTFRPGRRVFAAQALLQAPDGGLQIDSVVLGEQVRVVTKQRLGRRRGMLSSEALARVEQAVIIALDLPEQM
jgi:mRNA interferase MazF